MTFLPRAGDGRLSSLHGGTCGRFFKEDDDGQSDIGVDRSSVVADVLHGGGGSRREGEGSALNHWGRQLSAVWHAVKPMEQQSLTVVTGGEN